MAPAPGTLAAPDAAFRHGQRRRRQAVRRLRLSPNAALELGGAHLGRSRDEHGEVKGDAGFADAVGTLPLNNQWSLLGRLGVAHGRFNGPDGDSSGTGLKLGTGVQYQLNPTTAIRVEYEQYRLHDVFDTRARVGQVTGGLVVQF